MWGAPQQRQQFQQHAGYGGYMPQGYQPPPHNTYGQPAGSSSYYGQGQSYRHFAPPPSYAPPGVDPQLWQWFQSVDQDRSGKITSSELQRALLNSNWSTFNAETCRLMIGLFDKDKDGQIDIHEFAALWKYIQDWKQCFDRFDTDRSGNIDVNELGNALTTFGYNLSPQFMHTVVRVFGKTGNGTIEFDAFIQACVILKCLTDNFRVKDHQQTGTIRISYEEFLEMVLDNNII